MNDSPKGTKLPTMLRSRTNTRTTTAESPNGPSPNGDRRGKGLEYAVYAIGILAFFVFFWVLQLGKMTEDITENTSLSNHNGKSGQWHFGSSKKANMICSCVCSQRRRKRNHKVDLLNNTQLFRQATDAKDRLLEKLKKDYGEFFEPIFVDSESGGYRPFKPSNEVSMERLKRKLKIKVLSMQMQMRTQDSDFHGCDCSNSTAIRIKQVLEELDTEEESVLFEGMEEGDEEPTYYEKYTWATGGHSASAAHGNLYNESYTAYMESDLKDVFGSIGIEFEGRNYAMGGTSSATVISMCWKEVFGEDVDFFSWDYGMTDGNAPHRLLHYAYRGALSASRPAFMVIHNDGRSRNSRFNPLLTLEENGLALFRMVPELEKTMKDNFPDSQGISDDEINALPEYVRNYKCGTGIEKGDPYCSRDKFSKWGCNPRSKQTGWHPGFKDHALDGHGLALFLMEALLDALLELKEQAGENSNLLEELIEEDIALHKNFSAGPLPDTYKQVVDLETVNEELKNLNESTFDQALFMNGPSMCHTARLPSQIRYNGILTNSDMVGKPVPLGEETYYLGHDIKEAHKTATEDNKIRIVYDMGQRESKCKGEIPVIVKPDYPDSLYVNSLDGWARLRFPNKSEKDYYGYNPDQYQGIIVFHIKKCDWNKCPSNFLKIDNYKQDWEMKINNQLITKVIDLGSTAAVAMTEGGFRIEPNQRGQYEIEIKVHTENKYLEFANFVLW